MRTSFSAVMVWRFDKLCVTLHDITQLIKKLILFYEQEIFTYKATVDGSIQTSKIIAQ